MSLGINVVFYRTNVVNNFTWKLETTYRLVETCTTSQQGSYALVANKRTTSRGNWSNETNVIWA